MKVASSGMLVFLCQISSKYWGKKCQKANNLVGRTEVTVFIEKSQWTVLSEHVDAVTPVVCDIEPANIFSAVW